MEVLKQVNVMTKVERMGDDLSSQTVYLGRNKESVAYILTDVHRLVVKKAGWEVLKDTDTSLVGFHKISLPEGTLCHISGKKALSFLKEEAGGEQKEYMLNQCINGVIQAESYIWRERGFQTAEAYNQYWDEIEENGCRMYSNPRGDQPGWLAYIPNYGRTRVLFNRIKNVGVVRRNLKLVGTGVLSDSYHQVHVEIICDTIGKRIENCDIEFLRAPGKRCFENRGHRKKMEGLDLSQIGAGDIVNWFGRGNGCYHLVEITKDLLKAMQSV